jgi:methyl-accepting chemotaxis protein
MQDIDRFTSTVATALQEQNLATGDISRNVAGAAEGAKVVVSVLDQVAGAVTQTRNHADTMLKASETVATAAIKVRENVDNFLNRVAI